MKPSVLAIDDEPVLRRLMTKLLTTAGFTVRTAASGTAALASLAEGEAPSVIVCDLLMPEMSGYELVSAIRANPAWAEIPILVLTGQPNSQDRARALAAGANGYMTKPFSSYDLVDAIRGLLAPPGERRAS